MSVNYVHKNADGWKSFQTKTANGARKRPAMMRRSDYVTPAMRENRANRNRSNSN